MRRFLLIVTILLISGCHVAQKRIPITEKKPTPKPCKRCLREDSAYYKQSNYLIYIPNDLRSRSRKVTTPL